MKKLRRIEADKAEKKKLKVAAYCRVSTKFERFLIVFLEYLNLPGFPAGIILPAVGIWTSTTESNFWVALGVSVVAALFASWILYFLGYYGGDFLLKKYLNKFPKQEGYITGKMAYLTAKGNLGVFISKLIPMARTLISIPAGTLKLNFWGYTLSSALGIFLWNAGFIAMGYFFEALWL